MGNVIDINFKNYKRSLEDSKIWFCNSRQAWIVSAKVYLRIHPFCPNNLAPPNEPYTDIFSLGSTIIAMAEENQPIIVKRHGRICIRDTEENWWPIINDNHGHQCGWDTKEEAEEALKIGLAYLVRQGIM